MLEEPRRNLSQELNGEPFLQRYPHVPSYADAMGFLVGLVDLAGRLSASNDTPSVFALPEQQHIVANFDPAFSVPR